MYVLDIIGTLNIEDICNYRIYGISNVLIELYSSSPSGSASTCSSSSSSSSSYNRLVAILWVGEWLKTNIFSPCGEEVLEDEVEEEEEAEEEEENWRKDR